MTTKKKRDFRLTDETMNQLDFIVRSLSSELGLKLDRTKVLEKLILDEYHSRSSDLKARIYDKNSH